MWDPQTAKEAKNKKNNKKSEILLKTFNVFKEHQRISLIISVTIKIQYPFVLSGGMVSDLYALDLKILQRIPSRYYLSSFKKKNSKY